MLIIALAGNRNYNSASINNQGSNGNYWSSSPNGILAYRLYFDSTDVSPAYSDFRANGFSLRCVREITPPYGQPGGRGGDPDVPGGGGPV